MSNFTNTTTTLKQMKKVVLKVELSNDRIKQKAMKRVSGLSGVVSVRVDVKDNKLTLIGDTDPVTAVKKLRKLSHAEILSVGPAKEEKKEETKKDQPKKEDEKKPDPKVVVPYDECGCYNYPVRPLQYYYVGSVEEDPNGCVIC